MTQLRGRPPKEPVKPSGREGIQFNPHNGRWEIWDQCLPVAWASTLDIAQWAYPEAPVSPHSEALEEKYLRSKESDA